MYKGSFDPSYDAGFWAKLRVYERAEWPLSPTRRYLSWAGAAHQRETPGAHARAVPAAQELRVGQAACLLLEGARRCVFSTWSTYAILSRGRHVFARVVEYERSPID